MEQTKHDGNPTDSLAERQNLIDRAAGLSFEERQEILVSLPETALHGELKKLYQRMYPNAIVDVTHGADEEGSDLLIIDQTPVGMSAYACVVQKGDIRGDSAGPVDKLVSQIKQSASSPKLSRTTGERYDIDRVWVVLVGKFTTRGAMGSDVNSRHQTSHAAGSPA